MTDSSIESPAAAMEDRSFRVLRRRIAFGFGVSVLLVAILGALSFAAVRQSVESDRLAFHQANDIVEFGKLRTVFESKMNAFREYLATTRESDIADLAASRAEFYRLLREFQARASAAERPLLARIAAAEQAHQAVLQRSIDLRRGGQTRDAVAVYLVRESGPRRQDLETSVDRFLEVKRSAMQAVALRSRRHNALATALILLVGLVAAGVVLALGFVLSRQLAGSFAVERRQRRRAEEAEARSAFLSQASELLGSSLEYRTTLSAVAELAVRTLADWCFVDMAEEGGLRRVAVAHRAPEHAPLAEELQQRYLLDGDAPQGPANVFRTGRAEVLTEVPDEFLTRIARSPEDREILRRLEIRSYLCVPIRARDQLLGLLTFGARSSGRYGIVDLRLAEELARRAGTAIDNARLYRDAQEAVRLRDDFLSIASHELKTPITTLQLQVQSLSRRLQTGADMGPREKLLQRLATAERQVERLGRLVSNLLDISRITSGRFELERETMDLATVVRDTVARLSEELERSGCAVVFHSTGDSHVGQWDRTRVEQIVTNLLSNASKYGAGKPVEVSLSGDQPVSRLSVRDHGIGIAPENQARIFDRFERAVSVRHYGGLGLGLWIVRQIVEAMGGHISVESRPGEGSLFTVDLPRHRAPESMAANQASS